METQRINWDSFKLKIGDLDEAKVIIINLYFNIISNSVLDSFSSNISKMKRGIVHKVIFGCVRGSDGKI